MQVPSNIAVYVMLQLMPPSPGGNIANTGGGAPITSGQLLQFATNGGGAPVQPIGNSPLQHNCEQPHISNGQPNFPPPESTSSSESADVNENEPEPLTDPPSTKKLGLHGPLRQLEFVFTPKTSTTTAPSTSGMTLPATVKRGIHGSLNKAEYWLNRRTTSTTTEGGEEEEEDDSEPSTNLRLDLEGARIVDARHSTYLVIDGKLRHIPNPEIYNQLFKSREGIQHLPEKVIESMEQGPALSQQTFLARSREGDVVYLVTNGVKRLITSQAMDKYQFNEEKIQVYPKLLVDNIPSGSDLK